MSKSIKYHNALGNLKDKNTVNVFIFLLKLVDA